MIDFFMYCLVSLFYCVLMYDFIIIIIIIIIKASFITILALKVINDVTRLNYLLPSYTTLKVTIHYAIT